MVHEQKNPMKNHETEGGPRKEKLNFGCSNATVS